MIQLSSVTQPRLVDIKKRIHELADELVRLEKEACRLEIKELKVGETWLAKVITESRFKRVKILEIGSLWCLTDKGGFYYDRTLFKREQENPIASPDEKVELPNYKVGKLPFNLEGTITGRFKSGGDHEQE